jgi:uncharacterized protein with ParB-like and HNH nuclease domain
MATLFKEVNYNLAGLIQQIDLGLIGLPDIQRPFVWKDTKVRDLVDSIYMGYRVGQNNLKNRKLEKGYRCTTGIPSMKTGKKWGIWNFRKYLDS